MCVCRASRGVLFLPSWEVELLAASGWPGAVACHSLALARVRHHTLSPPLGGVHFVLPPWGVHTLSPPLGGAHLAITMPVLADIFQCNQGPLYVISTGTLKSLLQCISGLSIDLGCREAKNNLSPPVPSWEVTPLMALTGPGLDSSSSRCCGLFLVCLALHSEKALPSHVTSQMMFH